MNMRSHLAWIHVWTYTSRIHHKSIALPLWIHYESIMKPCIDPLRIHWESVYHPPLILYESVMNLCRPIKTRKSSGNHLGWILAGRIHQVRSRWTNSSSEISLDEFIKRVSLDEFIGLRILPASLAWRIHPVRSRWTNSSSEPRWTNSSGYGLVKWVSLDAFVGQRIRPARSRRTNSSSENHGKLMILRNAPNFAGGTWQQTPSTPGDVSYLNATRTLKLSLFGKKKNTRVPSSEFRIFWIGAVGVWLFCVIVFVTLANILKQRQDVAFRM